MPGDLTDHLAVINYQTGFHMRRAFILVRCGP
jgi:hypothetical protein